jgi:UDP-N-acetylmuramoyl-L-alanyl-D-glutamate--2,6-diaminopimelate ligase
MHTLDRLFGALGGRAPALPVRGITSDSRKAQLGMIFVAIRGRRRDGHHFIGEAATRGAVAAVGERALRELEPPPRLPYLCVPDTRTALSHLAATFYDYPTRALYVIGVTGTKGKTTTSSLTHHLLQSAGHPTGLLCTVGVWHGREAILPRGHMTTPEAPVLQATLAEWVARGIGHAVIETSSHALALHRVDDVDYDLAIWTTLHPEHLDFHGDMESYFRAKASLFERAPFAILNADCPYAMRLRHRPHLSYGLGSGDLRATEIVEGPHSVCFTLHAPGFSGRVEVPGIGRFNVYNALAALGAATHLGLPLDDACRDTGSFAGVPGRMQIVSCRPVRIVVDFAHTPESLALALEALRPGTPGRLLLLTGAAGGRDPRNRVPTGRIAVELADLTVFTEEDFGREPLEPILATLERGARAAGGLPGRDYLVIRDRPAAIRFLIRHARPGDTILLTGKGHERYLARETGEIPWDEVAEVRRWVA